MQNLIQPQMYQKKCSYHNDKDIEYLQIGSQKQRQIGACQKCIVSNDLSGENLILISDILNMQSIDNPISKKYPILKDKKLLSNLYNEYISQQYNNPLQQAKTFLEELKNKIDLLKSYNQISQKGKFLSLFKDYMSDSTNQGLELSQFLLELYQKKQENTQFLQSKLESFQKTQGFIKQQQSFQLRFQDITSSIIDIIGKILTFDNKKDCFYQQVENNLQTINNQLETFKQLFLPSNQIKGEDDLKKETIHQFIHQNKKDISYELLKLTKTIYIQEIKLNESQKEHVNEQKIKQIQENIQVFNKNLYHIVYQFTPLTPNSFQIINVAPNNTILIKQFKPFQNQESQYTFCIGLKQLNTQQQQHNSLQQAQSYFFSNTAVEGRLNTRVKQGVHIFDQKISDSAQMRKLEVIFCLKYKQFTLLDLPKRENIIIAEDQRLEKIDLNQRYYFFMKMQGIQEINMIQFQQCPQIKQI
ncbi:hypothetical protein TTHERM_001141651 (macronuclear) [Tetrahymena thermophila SB210]|uniref:Uncharacterized protein n=1 Tax=Tetrahymena thermophila (strain SB210) TaxID=312017 RepID=W7XA08_TETTS|nr:hypothetical protein TTHERM_001141651 [Tetrahymena thermophila SB210]EWS74167.1 hypothetical protein TTHERM_001141651 [Tetrahymena thermophila SB210]|eukprot:XP_012653307.1 hypothetical protein TTHERM_001141651 [Tetrahymena thermophila SB210]